MRKFDLQLFAEDNPTSTGTTTAAETAQAVTDQETPSIEKPAPTATLKDSGEKKYSDDDVDRLIDQKFAEWQKKQQKAVDEAQKLATMNATQKAEYERDQLQKELDELKKQASIVEMSKTARKMLADDGITISDELLGMLVTPDAEETKAAVDGFSKAFTEAVESAVKDRLRGETPRVGTGKPAGSISEIEKRIKKYE